MFPVAPWSQIRHQIRPTPRFAAGIALLLCGSALSVSIAALMGRLVDGEAVALVAPRLVGAALGAALLSASGFYLVSTQAERGIATLRATMVGTALALPVHRVEESGTGDLVSRSTDDVAELSSAVTGTVPILSSCLFTVLSTAVALASVDWRFLGVLAVAPLYYAGARRYLAMAPGRYAEERAARSRRARRVLEAVHGAETVRAYGMEEEIRRGIRESSRTVMERGIHARGTLVALQAWITLCEFLTLALALLIGHGLHLSVGTVTGALLMLIRLRGPLMMLMRVLDTVQSAYACLARIAGMPAARPQEDTGAGEPTGRASLERACLSYGDWGVRGIDLRLDGQVVALVGASGAGKTTVAALLAGLRVPDEGRALIDGVEVSRLSDRERAGRVALISQEVHVFGTPREDLALTQASEERMREALRRVGADWAEDLDREEPLDPMQAQQLALARVLLLDPALLIMDEATAESGRLDAAAAEVMRGRTVLVVAHRLDQAALADKVLVMESGEVIEQGSHEELLARGEQYARLWQAWTRGRRG
ncbi:ABC transporter ATP-binding protein/permease [Corynebacterium mastitidis]|uniref:ABC transporter ATP-binding protein n=1 Tax=Corynebacterium mastitidis TaxID=161890 RepID=A0A2N0XAQ8_9CORY|nr:ABC transporter ATP-binding protein [Corynebacterium mastitidis]MCH6196152.1 ABC transporter ATP-binding protein/permease [Corynebacterium mastitidis]PKF69757.1 ABC transporter ATP-binding protein [Corynebacterium mastitidis]